MTPGKAKNKKNTNTFCPRRKKRKFANKMSFNENAKKTLAENKHFIQKGLFACISVLAICVRCFSPSPFMRRRF